MSDFSKEKIKYHKYFVNDKEISSEEAKEFWKKGTVDVTEYACDPLNINTDISVFAKYEKDKKRCFHHVMTSCCHLGKNSEKIVIEMVNSGDFTLREALYVFANSCERCANVLEHKYLGEEYGYEDGSEEYKNVGTTCEFCEE